MTREAIRSEIYVKGEGDRNQFVRSGRLDMDAVVQKFAEHFSDIWSKDDESFVEKYGRKLRFGTAANIMSAVSSSLRIIWIIIIKRKAL